VARNLAVANAKGMTTALATTKARRLDHRDARGRATAEPIDVADFVIDDLSEFLALLNSHLNHEPSTPIPLGARNQIQGPLKLQNRASVSPSGAGGAARAAGASRDRAASSKAQSAKRPRLAPSAPASSFGKTKVAV
jgi:hypothetical protein